MSALLKIFVIWGVLDSLWLAFRPAAWARFWGGWLARIGEGGVAPRLLALVELLVSVSLLRPRSRWPFFFGLVESLWLALSPASLARFWGGVAARIGEGGAPARALALVDLVASLAILRWRPSGRALGRLGRG